MKKILVFIMLMMVCNLSHAEDFSKVKYLGDWLGSKITASKIEKQYRSRLNDFSLTQYGYDKFKSYNSYNSNGGVADSYVLGIGDELQISLVGGKTETYNVKVDSQGQVIIKGINPISIDGLTLGDFESVLQSQISKLYIDTQSYVSLSKIRLIDVSVMGEVNNPGSYNISSLSKVSDVISLAGGLEKNGSLRNITVLSNGKRAKVDLYQLLAGDNNFHDVHLKSGDKVIVPTIGDTIAVIGDVDNVGIFELSGEDSSLIELIAGVNKRSIIEKSNFGKYQVLMVSAVSKDSNVLELVKDDKTKIFSATSNFKLSDVMQKISINYKKDMYPFFGVVERFNENSLSDDSIMFNPSLILRKQRDLILKPSDKIVLFSRKEISAFQDKDINDGLNKYETLFANNSVKIYGEVTNEGLYPIVDEIMAEDLIGLSGGLLPSAIKDFIEVIQNRDDFADSADYSLEELSTMFVKLKAGDAMRVNSNFKAVAVGEISITGEVMYPGKYSFTRGEKLSSLIKRAGGLTKEAYAYGTVYSRESARIKEKQQYKQAARTLEKSLAEYIAREKEPNHKQIEYSRDLIADIEKTQALGRIVVEADPDVLKIQPESDIILQAGDKIFVPKRSLTVHVMGEVLNPSNLKFSSGQEALEYIENAGGYSYYADKDRGFVLLPDGSSKPIKNGSWNFAEVSVPEGSTIIVPRDPDPFSFMETSMFITNVLSQIAITTAAIADIED